MNGNIIVEIGASILVVGICVVLQATTLLAVFFWLKKFFTKIEDHFLVRRNFFVVVSVVWILSVMHLMQVIVWAIAYKLLGVFGDFYLAFYFSVATLSTVGYGDITVQDGWKLFAGMEALSGPLMFGWSASFLFGTVSKFYQIRIKQS